MHKQREVKSAIQLEQVVEQNCVTSMAVFINNLNKRHYVI